MTPEKRRRFGRKLRGVRMRLRLTQAQLAIEVGVTESTVSRWESGIHEPDIRTRIQLDRVFGKPLEELTGVDPSDWETDGPKGRSKTHVA